MKPRLAYCWWLFIMTLIVAGSGCATTRSSDGMAERPWNAPMNWEHGLPPSMLEGR